MMTCRGFVSLLNDYVSGDLDPELVQSAQHHLGICPPCVAFLKTYQRTIHLLRQLPATPLPSDFVPRLCSILQAESGAAGGQGRVGDTVS